MIIDVNKLNSTKPITLEENLSIDKEKHSFAFPLLDVKSCLAKVKASRYNDLVICELSIQATVIVQSSYSLKSFELKVKDSETLEFASSKEDGEDIIEYKGNLIKLDDYIYDLIVLSIPMNPRAPGESLPNGVMSEDDFLKMKEEESDPRFDKLKDLDLD